MLEIRERRNVAETCLVQRRQLWEAQLRRLSGGAAPRLTNLIDQRLIAFHRDVPCIAARHRLGKEMPRALPQLVGEHINGFDLRAEVEAEVLHPPAERERRTLPL